MKGHCPVCNREYQEENWRTHHHILPRRFFKGEGELFELCRNCHNKLEDLIPVKIKLTVYEYKQILHDFIKKHKQ